MSVAIAMEPLTALLNPRQGTCMAEIEGTPSAVFRGSGPQPVRQMTSAIAAGDTAAFARFYRAWFAFALAEARRCCGRDEQFCLDVVQETMLRVIHRMKPLDSEATLSAWLRTSVRSVCIDLLRRDLRRHKRERRYAGNRREHVVAAATQRETTERLAWLRGQLAATDPDALRALDMRFRLGWTLARIGEALHLRTGAVDGRINRTIAQLRAAAQEDIHE